MRFTLAAICLLAFAHQPVAAADVFDRHTAFFIKQGARNTKPLQEFSMNDASRLKSFAANIDGACIAVKTDKDNWGKAIVSWAYIKGPDKPIPVLLIERFVTYRGDRENSTTAVGKNTMLFAGFGFDFDLGQIVPEGLGDDIGFTEAGAIASRKDSTLYAFNGSQLPVDEKKEVYDPNDHADVRARDFEGTWNVDVDGRWTGEWKLHIAENGKVQGTLTSSESKSSYPITGRISLPPHRIKLIVHLDNAEQTIDGYLWTKDKSAIAGTATLAERKFGFHARRVVTDKKPPSN